MVIIAYLIHSIPKVEFPGSLLIAVAPLLKFMSWVVTAAKIASTFVGLASVIPPGIPGLNHLIKDSKIVDTVEMLKTEAEALRDEAYGRVGEVQNYCSMHENLCKDPIELLICVCKDRRESRWKIRRKRNSRWRVRRRKQDIPCSVRRFAKRI